ncbi:MAG: mercury resistance system transport protein MerF [Bryobacteraceae bacterium]
MWRDRWFVLGVIGAALSCLACLTPVVVLVLGALGLGAWSGHLDVALVFMLLVFAGLAFYRYRVAGRRAS